MLSQQSRTALPASRTTTSNTRRNAANALSRNAGLARSGITAPDISARNFKSCRDVFYDCMDEFCANKDATLKRCACSARASEFDGMKQQLSKIEDKLLDFSQRLLTVNMDKEDAMVLNQATEGELAYAAKDKSESKKMLDQIAKKLNTSFDDNNFNQNLNAISLSLDTNAAFDNLDSMMGAGATAKSGTGLYNAALPVCREMAAEVCSDDDLAIAESGYQMTIEQDCNTVAKSYESQNEQARTKILESSALLDMSRLDIHQQRNSDDILTCKKKMLDMLTDSTVCGTDMIHCLDTTGRYINPTTGEAFLTPDLANLSKLITRPQSGQTWTKAAGNDAFISFLENKKKFLEPAMENCQDIADYVWTDFIEDALAQIKLAQESKLEQVRQSCTTLTTQCITDAIDSISEFDSRALSVFGVAADKTANAMCSDIRTACSALLDNTNNDWSSGMTSITAGKTYETLLSTCQEVGRQCIIQSCKSVTGNFGLCENVYSSINRKSIINRTSCWDEVSECVASAGTETIDQIMANLNRVEGNGTVYTELYPNYNGNPYDWCNDDKSKSDYDWRICRLTEEIWGNCEQMPSQKLDNDADTNKILVNKEMGNRETLLSWFARNTGTENSKYSCVDTTCPFGHTYLGGKCYPSSSISTECEVCRGQTFKVDASITNCCTGRMIGKNVCCNGSVEYGLTGQYCLPKSYVGRNERMIHEVNGTKYYLLCLDGTITHNATENTYTCGGSFVYYTIDTENNPIYQTPTYQDGSQSNYTITRSFKNNPNDAADCQAKDTYTCTSNDDGATWQDLKTNYSCDDITPTGYTITIEKNND